MFGMKPSDGNNPTEPPREPPIWEPFTPLGPMLNEMPPNDRKEVSRNIVEGLQGFQALFVKTAEHAGRLVIILNGGGVTVCVGVASTLISSTKPIIHILPAAVLFIAGLALCGFAVLITLSRLGDEAMNAFEDLVHISRNEMTPIHAEQAAAHRKRRRDDPPLLVFSFLCFIAGAIALVAGLAWPELQSLVVGLWSFIRSFI